MTFRCQRVFMYQRLDFPPTNASVSADRNFRKCLNVLAALVVDPGLDDMAVVQFTLSN